MKKILMILGIFLLAGCTTVPKGDPNLDRTYKQFQAPSEKARIYVYRNQLLGSAIRMNVMLDGRVIAATKGKNYLVMDLEPGKYLLASESENIAHLTFEAVSGENLFIRQEAQMGFGYARSSLYRVSEAEGKQGVLDCKLVTTFIPAEQNDPFR